MESLMAKRNLTANDIADWFITRVDETKLETITFRQVMNLVYFAQAWFVTHTGRKLFEENIEGWALGPAVPSVYERFCNMAAASIAKFDVPVVIKGERLEILTLVAEEYGAFTPHELELLATEKGGPWAKSRDGLSAETSSQRIIEVEDMKNYFGQKIGKV